MSLAMQPLLFIVTFVEGGFARYTARTRRGICAYSSRAMRMEKASELRSQRAERAQFQMWQVVAPRFSR